MATSLAVPFLIFDPVDAEYGQPLYFDATSALHDVYVRCNQPAYFQPSMDPFVVPRTKMSPGYVATQSGGECLISTSYQANDPSAVPRPVHISKDGSFATGTAEESSFPAILGAIAVVAILGTLCWGLWKYGSDD